MIMNSAKRFLTMMLAIVLCMTLVLPAFAAEGISDKEQALLDHFTAGTMVNGTPVVPPAKYVNDVTNELMKVELTDEQIDILYKGIDDVYALLRANGLITIKDIEDSAVCGTITGIISAAAKKVGYTLVYVPRDGVLNCYFYRDSDGAGIGGTGGVGSYTGVDTTTALVCSVAFTAVLALGVFVAFKKRMFSVSNG